MLIIINWKNQQQRKTGTRLAAELNKMHTYLLYLGLVCSPSQLLQINLFSIDKFLYCFLFYLL